MIYQPTPKTPSFGDLPLHYLAKLEPRYYTETESAELERNGVRFEKVWV
jgi:hypothetical protein